MSNDIPQSALSFEWKESENLTHPNSVSVSGSFNDWKFQIPLQRSRAGIWSLQYAASPGRYEYKYIVDDKWVCSKFQETVLDSGGNENNVCSVTEKSSTIDLKKVRFEWKYPCKTAFLIGSFHNWIRLLPLKFNPSLGIFVGVLGLVGGKFYQFKFIIDNRWVTDPELPVETDEKGNLNNVVYVSFSASQSSHVQVPFQPNMGVSGSNNDISSSSSAASASSISTTDAVSRSSHFLLAPSAANKQHDIPSPAAAAVSSSSSSSSAEDDDLFDFPHWLSKSPQDSFLLRDSPLMHVFSASPPLSEIPSASPAINALSTARAGGGGEWTVCLDHDENFLDEMRLIRHRNEVISRAHRGLATQYQFPPTLSKRWREHLALFAEDDIDPLGIYKTDSPRNTFDLPLPNWDILREAVMNDGDKTSAFLPPQALRKIITSCIMLMRHERNLLNIEGKTIMIGDLHGRYSTLLDIVDSSGLLFDSNVNLLFLGDYVDRATQPQTSSVRVLSLLYALKLHYPRRVWLLRGNHETRACQCSQDVEGEFCNEAVAGYTTEMYNLFLTSFDSLPLAAIVNRSFLCLHGGLCPTLNNLMADDLGDLAMCRFHEPPQAGVLGDVLWADPGPHSQSSAFVENAIRGCSFLFGKGAVMRVLERHGLLAIIRGHSHPWGGVQFHDLRDDGCAFPHCISLSSANGVWRHGDRPSSAALLIVDGEFVRAFRYVPGGCPAWKTAQSDRNACGRNVLNSSGGGGVVVGVVGVGGGQNPFFASPPNIPLAPHVPHASSMGLAEMRLSVKSPSPPFPFRDGDQNDDNTIAIDDEDDEDNDEELERVREWLNWVSMLEKIVLFGS